MKTLFLHPETWDLALDVSGNIAVATDDYQQAQDIATSCRVFYGDDYYNKTDGIPYLEEILGRSAFPLSLYQRFIHDRSFLVSGVTSVDVKFHQLNDRLLSGDIIFTNDSGRQLQVQL